MNMKLKLKLNAYSKVDLNSTVSAEYIQGVLKNYYTKNQVDEKINAIGDIDTMLIQQAIQDASDAKSTAENALNIVNNLSTDIDSINALLSTGKTVLDKETGEEGYLVSKDEKDMIRSMVDDDKMVILYCGTANN